MFIYDFISVLWERVMKRFVTFSTSGSDKEMKTNFSFRFVIFFLRGLFLLFLLYSVQCIQCNYGIFIGEPGVCDPL